MSAPETKKKPAPAADATTVSSGGDKVANAVKMSKRTKRKADTQRVDAEKPAKKKSKSTDKTETAKAEAATPAAAPEGKKSRFIVFVGNLPYTTTKATLAAHLAAVEPTDIRVMTVKGEPNRCKGFAFAEFARYDRMELCLSMFHHSTFADGKSEPRKINMELTVGGGGTKSKVRRDKLAAKNEKLHQERLRVAEQRATEKTGRKTQAETLAADESAMHPSRRRRRG